MRDSSVNNCPSLPFAENIWRSSPLSSRHACTLSRRGGRRLKKLLKFGTHDAANMGIAPMWLPSTRKHEGSYCRPCVLVDIGRKINERNPKRFFRESFALTIFGVHCRLSKNAKMREYRARLKTNNPEQYRSTLNRNALRYSNTSLHFFPASVAV